MEKNNEFQFNEQGKSEQERAKAILKQLEGLSIASAHELLDRCDNSLMMVTIGKDWNPF